VDTAGPAEQRQYSVAHSLSRVASDIFMFMRQRRPGLYELARARLCDARRVRLCKRREAPDAHDVRGEEVAPSRKGVELRAKKVPTPSLFLCKCSFRESCTCGLRKLEPDDWERFQGAEELTQSARREMRRFERSQALLLFYRERQTPAILIRKNGACSQEGQTRTLKSLFSCGNLLLQFFKPVQHDVDLCYRCGLFNTLYH
jgi:hypothetical protein